MDNSNFRQNISVQFCFPDHNSSCRKELRAGPGNLFLYFFLSCVSVCTVFLNLLVIISISHFKQLHTPTNLLILSLAVADLLVGLVVMPVKIMQLFDSCWYFGKVACSVSKIIIGLLVLISLCNLVFIAVDRYIAISDPLLYPSRVTVSKMSVCIILGWCGCLVYVIIYMYSNEHLLPSQMFTRCEGECVVFVKQSWVIAETFVFFITPCSVILILYSIVFHVARRQAKAVRAAKNDVSQNPGGTSETKAARTLGIVIFFYMIFWIPFYLSSLMVKNLTSLSMVWTVFTWLMFISSSVNPLIYAIFYPWFRTSAKYIILCRVFRSSSSTLNLYKERS